MQRNSSSLILIFILGLLIGLILRPYLPKQISLSFPTPTPTSKPIPTIPPATQVATAKVAEVVDGDTVELDTGQKVRYIGINTPETKHPTKGVECYGHEASTKNKELVEGKTVRLEKDVSDVDRYGRLLRYVYLPTQASPSGMFVNDYLVREGYAYTSTFPPDVAHEDEFIEAQGEAQSQNKGLWQKCNP